MIKKRKRRRKNKIKFSKKIVVSCIIIIVAYTIFQSYVGYKLGTEVTPTLTTCVYTFFGGELAFTVLARIFDKEDGVKPKSLKDYKKATTDVETTESVG